MPLMDISLFDNYKSIIEALSGGKNTVLFDDQKLPSIMVRFPKLKYTDVGLSKPAGAPSDFLPAFLVNGAGESGLVPFVLIGKYISYIYNNRAYSLPYKDPATNINFNNGKLRCTDKGTGWHLMTNAEWAAVALFSKINATMPRGNNKYLQSTAAAYESGIATQTGVVKGVSGTARSYTGSGPNTWNHDYGPLGIADLNGNVWGWCDGLKITAGVASIMTHNGANDGYPGNTFTMAEANWRDTATDITAGLTSGHKILTLLTGDLWTGLNICATSDETGAAAYGNDVNYFTATDERMLLCGGDWSTESGSGVFARNMTKQRTEILDRIGFRLAFVSLS
jgi:hypothetical protein